MLHRRRGGIGRRAGLKIQCLPLVKLSVPRTVANMSDPKKNRNDCRTVNMPSTANWARRRWGPRPFLGVGTNRVYQTVAPR